MLAKIIKLGGKMPNGPESKYTLSEEEREMIDHHMPEGSDRAKASENRERWMLSAGITDSETIQDIHLMNEVSNHYCTEFGGTVRGHKIEVSERRTEYAGNIYKGEVDGMTLTLEDAQVLYNRIRVIREGVEQDTENISKIEKNDDHSRKFNINETFEGK